MKLKKLMCALMIALSLVVVTGCQEEQKQEQKEEEEVVKGKCDVKECIKLLKATNTIEEMNEIIGFEAEKSEYSEEYKWQITKKTSLTAKKSSENYILQTTMIKDEIASDKVDFGVYSELKELLDTGKSFTYEEAVQKLGGVEGVLDSKTSTSDGYMWVDKHGRTFRATFSTTINNKCSIMTLR